MSGTESNPSDATKDREDTIVYGPLGNDGRCCEWSIMPVSTLPVPLFREFGDKNKGNVSKRLAT